MPSGSALTPSNVTSLILERMHMTLPSPNLRRVGMGIITFATYAGFTRVGVQGIAQPPTAFVTGLRPSQLPDRAAR
ncbi:hypothetical protein CK215_28600 [Mesorhizobium sp. WSM3864]|nr:hypothetical protein CK215_28600 [Mesorhizobium sp. WSM3864]